MKPAFEAPRLQHEKSSLVAFERRDANFDRNWHYHPEFELTWIRSGSGTRLVGDHSATYGPEDLVFLGPNLPHTWFSRSTSCAGFQSAIVIQFRADAFPASLLTLPEFSQIAVLLRGARLGIQFPRETARKLKSSLLDLTRAEGMAAWAKLTEILQLLSLAQNSTPLAGPLYHHHRSYHLNSRMEKVTAYLEKHFRESLSLSDVARVAGLNPSAFSRFFRKMTAMTFVSFRNRLRLQEAARLLADTALPVTRIAFECGFDNLSNFNRRFLKFYRHTPLEYRRQHNPPLGRP